MIIEIGGLLYGDVDSFAQLVDLTLKGKKGMLRDRFRLSYTDNIYLNRKSLSPKPDEGKTWVERDHFQTDVLLRSRLNTGYRGTRSNTWY